MEKENDETPRDGFFASAWMQRVVGMATAATLFYFRKAKNDDDALLDLSRRPWIFYCNETTNNKSNKHPRGTRKERHVVALTVY